MWLGKTLPYSADCSVLLLFSSECNFDRTNRSGLLMQDALGRVRCFVIVFLKQGTPNIFWSNCTMVLLFSIKNGNLHLFNLYIIFVTSNRCSLNLCIVVGKPFMFLDPLLRGMVFFVVPINLVTYVLRTKPKTLLKRSFFLANWLIFIVNFANF